MMPSLHVRPHNPFHDGKEDFIFHLRKERCSTVEGKTDVHQLEHASSSAIEHVVLNDPVLLITTPNMVAPPTAKPSTQQSDHSICPMLNLPLTTTHKILHKVLIPDHSHLQIIPVTSKEVQSFRKTIRDLSVFRTCRLLQYASKSLYFGENIFITSSPSTSSERRNGIRYLSGEVRTLITKLSLKLDWADELWIRFPLVASSLLLLVRLSWLEIYFVRTHVSLVDEGNFTLNKEESQEITRRDARGFAREGEMAQIILKAEKKMFTDVVLRLKALKMIRLVGFADEDFARKLELTVGGTAPDGVVGWKEWLDVALLGWNRHMMGLSTTA